MTQGTIGLLLVERVATDRLKDIEVIGGVPALGHLGVPFAGKTGPVTGFAKEIDVEFPDRVGTGGVMPARGAITASGKASQDGGPADPADGLANVGIGESCAPGSQTIDVGCLDQGVTVASERAGSLVVSKEEDDVGLFGSLRRAQRQKVKGDDEFFHFVFFNSSSDP